MTPKAKRLLITAAVVTVSGIGFYLWWNAPVRAATRALNALVETLQISGDESSLARQGKAARLKRAVTDPVDIKFKEAGREGAWSAESLQIRYASGAMGAKSVTIVLENLEATKTDSGTVSINALLKANYTGQGATVKDIDRPCRWIMKLQEGNWLISSFRESDS